MADGSLYAVDAGFSNMSRNVLNCGVTSRPGSLSDAIVVGTFRTLFAMNTRVSVSVAM